MRNLLIGLLLSWASFVSQSQGTEVKKTVYCDSTEKILKYLSTNHGEKPIWSALVQEEDSVYTLLINQKTKTWTLLQLNIEVACILGSGEGYHSSLQL